MQNAELEQYLKKFLANQFTSFLSAPAEAKAVRVNTLQKSSADLETRLNELQIEFTKIAFNPNGFILIEDNPPLSHTLDFFRGDIQYQGISSQVPALILNPQPGERVLDMAAAPGSKSTQMAALMQNKGSLYLNDISRQRLQSLNTNTQKAGVHNQVLLNYNGERLGNLFPNYFDKILLDAPCTALGTLSSQPEIEGWWSNEKLEKLCGIQERLIISAMKALKPGGEVVYSTCSIAPEENEALIQKIINKYPLEILSVDSIWKNLFASGFSEYAGENYSEEMKQAVRIFPHIHNQEGFFVIRLRKTASHEIHEPWRKGSFVKTQTANEVSADLKEISDSYEIDMNFWKDFRFIRTQKRLWMTNQNNESIPAEGLTSAGLLLGEKKQFMWKLYNQSARFLNAEIKNRRVQLSAEQMQNLFADAKIPSPVRANGYYVIEWDGQVIGSLYSEAGTAQIRLPHRFRLIL